MDGGANRRTAQAATDGLTDQPTDRPTHSRTAAQTHRRTDAPPQWQKRGGGASPSLRRGWRMSRFCPTTCGSPCLLRWAHVAGLWLLRGELHRHAGAHLLVRRRGFWYTAARRVDRCGQPPFALQPHHHALRGERPDDRHEKGARSRTRRRAPPPCRSPRSAPVASPRSPGFTAQRGAAAAPCVGAPSSTVALVTCACRCRWRIGT